MEYEFTWLTLTILLISGVIAGFINTLAGGGSLLTLPALMLLGMPADIANATNRVSVFFSAMEGARSFNRHDKLDKTAIIPILVPTVVGSLAGALLASYLSPVLLEPLLLGILVLVALIILLRPATVEPTSDTVPLKVTASPAGFAGLFFAGLFGGFVQAGVGFILLAVLCGILRYDLVRANALKMAAVGIFTTVALAVFILRGQVVWIPGLVLTAGTVIGVRLSVTFALTVNQRVLRWFLFCAVVIACIATWIR